MAACTRAATCSLDVGRRTPIAQYPQRTRTRNRYCCRTTGRYALIDLRINAYRCYTRLDAPPAATRAENEGTMTIGMKNVLGLLNRKKMLTERQEALLEQERRQLTALRDALDRFGADVAPADARTLGDTLAHLDELFLLVIAGEFNSGKSSFINALL